VIDTGQINLPAIVRHYMLANTPRYLYRNLRAEPSVASLADASTPKELLESVSAYEGKPDRTAEDVAVAYAMLVALSYQDRAAALEALADWRPRALSWADRILSIIGENFISMTVRELKARPGRISAVESVPYRTPTTVVGMP
jgi:hypothetical protein